MSQLKTLGGLRLESSSFTQPKPLVLLSYLSLEGSQSRRHVAELFWPEGNQMKSLSMTLTRLRQGAGRVIEADDKKTWITAMSDVQKLLESLDKSQWQEANNLYAGAFLEGVVLEDWSSELEEWVYTTREYLAERVQYALLNLAEETAKQQDFGKVRELAERAYKLPGLSGHEVPSLKRLYPLLCASQSLLAPEVRKELESYGINVQLNHEKARESFKPTKASTVPQRGTSFVGRDEELTQLATLLSKPKVSLLTLLGPAGVGKTRLALHLANEQQSLGAFKDGIFFIPLDALSDATLLAPTLLSHLGLGQQGQTEPLTQLTEFIAEKNILLVLDNFEHLIEASSFVPQLLGTCPNLKLLVTSRERLNLEEEHSFMLEGLPYPHTYSEGAKGSDAVQLFNERARQVQPHFDLDTQLNDIVCICELVDGLPLGLELAASWVRLMSCNEIAKEIKSNLEFLASSNKNTPERHRSLKAAFEYSWNLLTPKEQDVLRKLSVFIGGFRREAASEIIGATIPVLVALADKSLLRVLPNGRYDRHPLLYQFTKEKLIESNENLSALQERYTGYYLAFANYADSQLQSREQVLWFDRLGEELDNLREVLGYLSQDDVSKALQLATSLGYFWNTRGFYTEGIHHFTTLLDNTNEQTMTRARACIHAANLLWKRGHHAEAKTFYEEGLAITKSFNEVSSQAEALMGLGRIAELNQGDFEGAQSYYQHALELSQKSQNKLGMADALRLLGALHIETGNYPYAQECYETSERLYGDLENFQGRAKSLTNLATVLTYLGDHHRAHTATLEALELFRKIGDKHGIGIALLNLGLNHEGNHRHKGNVYYQESLQIFRALGDKRMVSHLLNNLAGNFQKLSEPHKAKELLEESLSLQKHIGDVSLIAHALFLLGETRWDLGQYKEAWQSAYECITLCRNHQDNWTLMRILEASANWYIEENNYVVAQEALDESMALAQKAGDQGILARTFHTQTKLAQSLEKASIATSSSTVV